MRIKLETIWLPSEVNSPVKMNAEFILMYLLNNSDQQLRIELMSLMKSIMPLPMYFRQFDDILKVSDTLTLNDDLIWIMKYGITICSIGLHTRENMENEKGKSSLLNKIFFTSFLEHQTKHTIIERVPFISIRTYDDLFPINIIDIPHDCP